MDTRTRCAEPEVRGAARGGDRGVGNGGSSWACMGRVAPPRRGWAERTRRSQCGGGDGGGSICSSAAWRRRPVSVAVFLLECTHADHSACARRERRVRAVARTMLVEEVAARKQLPAEPPQARGPGRRQGCCSWRSAGAAHARPGRPCTGVGGAIATARVQSLDAHADHAADKAAEHHAFSTTP